MDFRICRCLLLLPAGIYLHNNFWNLFKVKNVDTKTTAMMSVLISLLLTLKGFHTLFRFFYCWLWTSKCWLGTVFVTKVFLSIQCIYYGNFWYPYPPIVFVFLDTSRKPLPGEKCGVSWFFEPENSMLGDIGKHEYLEYGKHEGAIYGTKLSTIKNIIKCGKTPVIDPEIPVRYP